MIHEKVKMWGWTKIEDIERYPKLHKWTIHNKDMMTGPKLLELSFGIYGQCMIGARSDEKDRRIRKMGKWQMERWKKWRGVPRAWGNSLTSMVAWGNLCTLYDEKGESDLEKKWMKLHEIDMKHYLMTWKRVGRAKRSTSRTFVTMKLWRVENGERYSRY